MHNYVHDKETNRIRLSSSR